MPKRIETRFGIGGESVPTDPNSKAQRYFLNAVLKVAPEAVAELAALADDPNITLKPDTFVRDRSLQRLDQPLLDWADLWGFTDPWLMRVARRTAEFWRRSPKYQGHMWSHATSYFEPEFPTLASPDWNPFEEREEDYRARLDDYIEAVKQTPGTSKVPTKRNLRHFEWLVLEHVKGLRPEQIAEHLQTGLDVSTITKALIDTAALCGITRRAQRGRPAKIRK